MEADAARCATSLKCFFKSSVQQGWRNPLSSVPLSYCEFMSLVEVLLLLNGARPVFCLQHPCDACWKRSLKAICFLSAACSSP
eukprot:4863105-Amphidinium_carterae.3